MASLAGQDVRGCFLFPQKKHFAAAAATTGTESSCRTVLQTEPESSKENASGTAAAADGTE